MRGNVTAIAAAFAVAAIVPVPVGAQGPDAGVPTYVSARFKTVAKRAFREVLAAEVAQSCPKEKEALCTAVVARTGDALDAALRGDDAAIRTALDGLFVDASINGALASLVGDLIQTDDETIRVALSPFARCLSAALGDRPLHQPCSIEAPPAKFVDALFRALGFDATSDKQQVVAKLLAGLGTPRELDPALVKQALQAVGFKGNDVQVVYSFLVSLYSTHRIEPALAIRTLAAIATVDRVSRPDVRIYLLRLAELQQQGTDQGLFDAGLRFLTADLQNDAPDAYTIGVLANYLSEKDANRIFGGDSTQEQAWRTAISNCRQDVGAFDRWVKERDPYLKELRRGALLGRRVDYSPAESLLAYHERCSTADARQIRQLKREVRYFIGPVKSYLAMYRYGAPGLALAALLDFVRTRDEARFERDLRRTAVYAVAELGVQRRNAQLLAAEDENDPATFVTKKKLAWLGDAVSSCEIQVLAAGVDAPMPSVVTAAAAPSGSCWSLVSGTTQPTPAISTRPAGVVLAAWIDQNRGAMVASLTPLLSQAGVSAVERGVLTDSDTVAIKKAVALYAEGDTASARRTIVRLGVDLLATHLDTFVGEITGASEKACVDEYRTRTIFSSVGAGCAAHLLIVAAYRPIADYYWGSAAGRESSDQVASTVYRDLFESPVLDSTPLILNLGVGGTWVSGREVDWGRRGYAALTVVDKIGLAFAKTSGPRSRFETGVFVGGFLDALVRTAANVGKDERYWLAGLTAGWPRIAGVNVGFELHAGAAMPFQFGSGSRFGFAAGAAVVVPFNWVLDEGGK